LTAVIYKHSAPPELHVNARRYFGCSSAALLFPGAWLRMTDETQAISEPNTA